MREALLILLGGLFLLGAVIDWIQLQEELKDMRSEDEEIEDGKETRFSQ